MKLRKILGVFLSLFLVPCFNAKADTKQEIIERARLDIKNRKERADQLKVEINNEIISANEILKECDELNEELEFIQRIRSINPQAVDNSKIGEIHYNIESRLIRAKYLQQEAELKVPIVQRLEDDIREIEHRFMNEMGIDLSKIDLPTQTESDSTQAASQAAPDPASQAAPASTQATAPASTQATTPDSTQATTPDSTQATTPDSTQATTPNRSNVSTQTEPTAKKISKNNNKIRNAKGKGATDVVPKTTSNSNFFEILAGSSMIAVLSSILFMKKLRKRK